MLRRARGFSVIELMVTMALLAILAAIAAPAYTDSIRRYKVNAVRDDLLSSMQLARTEAVRRGLPVLLTKTTGCTGASTDANTWNCGWEMVVDANSNGSKDSGELVLQTSEVPTSFSVAHPSLGATLQFNIWGNVSATQTFYVRDPSAAAAKSATVCMGIGGKIRKSAGEVTCP